MLEEYKPDLKSLEEEHKNKKDDLIKLLNEIDIKSAIAALKFESILGTCLPIIYEAVLSKLPNLKNYNGREVFLSDLVKIKENIKLDSFLGRLKGIEKTKSSKSSEGSLSSYAANKNFIRGEFYDVHARDYMDTLFGEFSKELMEERGFDYSDALKLFDFVNNTSIERINHLKDKSKIRRDELISLFKREKKEFSKTFPTVNINNKKQCYNIIDNHVNFEFMNNLTDVFFFTENDINETIKDELENERIKRLLNHITLREFSVFENTNTYNIFSNKPFIFFEDRYFCVHLDMLFNAFYQSTDDHLRESPIIKKRYNKHRALTLGRKAAFLISSVLDKAEKYEEVYYDSIYTGLRCEVDGLIKYKNTLFIIEAKAHRVTQQAIDGKERRIEKHVDQIVNDAYSQCIRARESMFSSSHTPNLRDKRGKPLDLDLSEITEIILLPISQERLDEFTSNPQYVIPSGRFDSSDMPWAINIFDLYVVTDMLTTPHNFLDYIKRRVENSVNPKIYIHDELDWLGYYLHDRLRGIENIEDTGIDLVALEPNSERFDEFYLKGNQKPRLYTDQLLGEIINKMSLYEHGFECAKTFCFFDKKGQEQLRNMVEKQEKNLISKRKSGSVFFSNNEQKKASIFCFYTPNHEVGTLDTFFTGRVESVLNKLEDQDMNGYELYLVKIPLMSNFSVTGVDLVYRF
ncbi:hypothetical protein L4D15_23595 [Enterovibrio norvegicus]|uniref:hypothetical protein n=1 Tax=Enterovibrio norvegicus TaxID=188144 RepID=UPI003D13CF21